MENLAKSRIGEKRTMTCGQEAEIIAYRSSRDLDLRFLNSNVRKHCTYDAFKKGNVLPGKISHIGEKHIANNGLEMEIIAYRTREDIDIRFSDGYICEHKTYRSFKNGGVLHPTVRTKPAKSNKPKVINNIGRIGEKNIACNGMEMEIIAYRGCKNCDVRFANGIIVKDKTYHQFIKGTIGLPTDNRIGETRIAKNGMTLTVIAYRSAEDIDIQFEDGTIVEHRTYAGFLKGTIKYPEHKRLGEKKIARNGLWMEIIAYRSATDIDIKFEDGQIRTHASYSNFKKGTVGTPNPISSRVGEITKAGNGMEMKLVEAKDPKKITIQFVDGTLVKERTYTAFVNGTIAHPHIGSTSDKNFHGVFARKAFKDGEDVYYDCTFPDGSKDLCTPQEIMNRMGVASAF